MKQDDDAGTVLIGRRLDDEGSLAGARVISPPGQTCFAPQLAPHEGHVVVAFQCLESGVWLARLDTDGKTVDGRLTRAGFGDGAQLALARDGRTAAWTIARDEGHLITASDVVVADLDGFTATAPPRATRLESERVERAPGVSDVRPDGSRVLTFLVGEGDVVLTTVPVTTWR